MDYFEFETLVEDEGNDKYLILIIYDISDNKTSPGNIKAFGRLWNKNTKICI